MRYAHIDENNILQGWYDDSIDSVIPEPKIAVTDEVFSNALQNGHNKVNSDGTSEFADLRTTEEIANEYQWKRESEYPSIGDQLDMIYRAGLGGDEFQAAIAAIKTKYPKPE